MRWVRTFVAGLVLAGLATAALADYVEVERAATIKVSPSGDAAIIVHPVIGTHLDLLDDGSQTAGYFHVTVPAATEQGWIYHTLVTRHPDDATGGNTPPTPTPTAPSAGQSMKAHFIDMGQGNSTLLEFSCGAILIDAGGENATTTAGLVTYLNNFFARRTDLNRTINTVIITHTHKDHNLALRTVVENFTVNNYVFNGHTLGSGTVAAKWMLAHANDNGRHVNIEIVREQEVEQGGANQGFTGAAVSPLQCQGASPTLRILAGPYSTNPGWSTSAYKNENNASLLVRVDFGSTSFLFPGDEETDAIGAVLNHYGTANVIRADVLEVGHHGSDNGTTVEQLAAIKPKIAVISMGECTANHQSLWTAWAYGHPRKQTVDALEQAVTETRTSETAEVASATKTFALYTIDKGIYATGWDGDVVITADDSGHYSVETNKHPPQSCTAN